jgi:DNA polymerase-3 subunit alpha
MAQLPNAVQAAEQARQNNEIGMMDLFGDANNVIEAPPLPTGADLIWGDKHRLKAEKDTLGLYLTGHPIDVYRDELKRYTGGARLDDLADTGFNGSCYFSGLIMDIANFGTRSVITLDDGTSRLEVSCYAERFNRLKDKLKVDEVIIVKGSIRERDGRMFARLDNVLTMVEARLRWIKKISVKIHAEDVSLLERMQPLLKSAQPHVIPQILDRSDEDEDDYYQGGNADGGEEYGLYDEEGNDLLANSSSSSAPVVAARQLQDGCLPLGLSIYESFGIANVNLSEHWRLYPNDDNFQYLKDLVPAENLHFHYS